MAEPRPLPPRRNHEGKIIRVPPPQPNSRRRRRAHAGGAAATAATAANNSNSDDVPHDHRPARNPSSSHENSHRSFPGHDDRSVGSAASSAVSALTMGTARRPAHTSTCTCTSIEAEANRANRAKDKDRAAVIGGEYGGGGSAVGIDIDIPADVADNNNNNNNNNNDNNNNGTAGNAAQQQRNAHGNSNRNRPPPPAAAAAAAARGAGLIPNGSHNRRGRFRPSSHSRDGAVALPILAEDSDSDSDGSDGVEDANHIGNNSNNTCIHSHGHNHNHGHNQTNEPSESTSTDRPHPRSVGRTNTRVHAYASALASATDGSRASTPYVTDIGYSDDDTRRTVAPQRLTWWDRLGQWVEDRRSAARARAQARPRPRRHREGERLEGGGGGGGGGDIANYYANTGRSSHGARGGDGCSARWWCDEMTVTNKRMVGVGLLLLSAVIVIGCAVGFRNNDSNNSSKNHGPSLEEEERPTDNDSLLPGGGNRLNEPTAAPTPWTVPEYQPTVPVGSSSVCSSPIMELPTDNKNKNNNLQSDDKLGTSLAMDRAGRTIVAGAPNADNLGSNAGIGSLDTGAAFVYALPAVGGDVADAHVTKLVAADGVRGMGFGTSVAMSDGGDVIVVGAPSVDVDFIDKVGAAYVFRKKETDGLWYEEARLVPSEPISRMQFGRSVAINEDGTRIVVGAPGSRRQANGSVTIFTYKSDGGWAYTTHIPDRDSDEAMFGLSVDISNDYVVVGAPLAGYRMEGEAYLFSADTAWDPVAMFTGSNGRDEFGVAVSIDGDRIAIGSQFANTQFGYNSGSVFLYQRNIANDQWEAEVQISRAGMVTQGYKFGSSVDLTGTRLMAGAPGNSAAYVFALEGNTWKETQRIEHSDGSFGTSVAVSSNSWNAVGDPFRDDSAGSIFAADNCHA